MKTQKYFALKTGMTMISALAVLFAPIVQVHAVVASPYSYTVVTSLNEADAVAVIQKSDQEVTNSLPDGYSVSSSTTIMTSIDSTNMAAIETTVADILAKQAIPNFALIECVVAVTVIVIGTVVIVKLYYLCKKVLPPTQTNPTNSASTNSADNRVSLSGSRKNGLSKDQTSSDTNVYAAWIVVGKYVPQQCDCGSDDNGVLNIPYSVTNPISGSNPSSSLGQPTWTPSSQGITTNELANQLQKIGLIFSSTSSSYSSNGISVPNLSNIVYVDGVLTVKTGNSLNTNMVVFQRTTALGGSMTNWVSFFTNTIVGGSVQGSVTDSDAPPGGGYYRMVILSP